MVHFPSFPVTHLAPRSETLWQAAGENKNQQDFWPQNLPEKLQFFGIQAPRNLGHELALMGEVEDLHLWGFVGKLMLFKKNTILYI